MKKIIMNCIIGAAFVLFCMHQSNAQSQLSRWHVAPNVINFGSTPPNISGFSSITANAAYNSICDNSGNLVFYIAGNTIYNKINTAIGTISTHPLATSEIAIVPNPGNYTDPCQEKYFVIYGLNFSGLDSYYYYGEFDALGNSGVGTWTPNSNPFAISTSPFNCMAVSKVVNSSSGPIRYLYLSGTVFPASTSLVSNPGPIPVCTITSTNISTPFATVLAPASGSAPTGMEMELSNNGDKLIFTRSYVGGVNDLVVININPFTGLNVGLPTIYATGGGTIHGIEISNDGSKVFYSKSGAGVFWQDLGSSTFSPSVVPGSLSYANGMLEKKFGGNEIVCASSSNLRGLTTGSTPALSWTLSSLALPTLNNVVSGQNVHLMPDQIDGENYDVGKSVLVPSFTVNPVWCYGSPVVVNGSASYGTLNSVVVPNAITNHWWTVTECNPTGTVLFGTPTIVQPPYYTPYAPGAFTIPLPSAGGPAFNCGKYYQIRLTVQNCDVTQEAVKVIYIQCPPTVDLGSDINICKGDCVTLFPQLNGSKKKFVFQWSIMGDEPTPLGADYYINVCPTQTTTYCVTATSTITGCSATDCITVNVGDVNAGFNMSSNAMNSSYFQLTCTPFQTTNTSAGFSYMWIVDELDASNNPVWTLTSYDLANPSFTNVSCWWSLPSPEVFDGLDAVPATGPVIDPVGCSPSVGHFRYNTVYRITLGAWSDKCPWKQMTQTISSTPPNFASGFIEPGVVTVEENVNAPDMSYFVGNNGNHNGQGNGNQMHSMSFIPTEGVIQGLKLFPNPAENMVNIEYSLNKDAQASILITDIAGRLIKSVNLIQNSSNLKLNLSEMSSGTYLINLIEAGFLKTTERLVVNK